MTTARGTVEEFIRRQKAGDESVLDDDGLIVEHCSCRDDMALVEQLRAGG